MSKLPELYEVRVKARSLAYLYVAGAALGALALALPHSDDVRELPILLCFGLAAAIGAGVYLRAATGEEWQLHAILVLGTAIVALAELYGEASLLYPLLYSWPAVYAFYFFGLRQALAHVAFAGVNYAIVLTGQDERASRSLAPGDRAPAGDRRADRQAARAAAAPGV